MFSQILPNENLRPTPFHYLISLLNRHNMLLRCYTQNFDGLEELCGIPEDKIIYSHGNIKKCHCLDCKSEVSFSYCLSEISEGRAPTCQSCNNIFVKPDIIFIGETLPKEFIDHKSDMANADLMIIAGTSLTFYPFANLPCEVGNGVPRFLINNEKCAAKTVFCLMFGIGLNHFLLCFTKIIPQYLTSLLIEIGGFLVISKKRR